MKKLTSVPRIVLLLAALGLNFAQDQAGAQTTCVSPLSDIYFTKYIVSETALFTETNTSPPVLQVSNAYFFTAEIELETNYTATSAQLLTSGSGAAEPMGKDGTRLFITQTQATNFADITNAYPAGDYTFFVSNSSTTLTLPNDLVLPNAPTLSDYTADQNIDPTKDFTLRWNPFKNATSKDLIDVTISGIDGVYQSPSYGCPGTLTGTATSFVIPAGTLTSNTTASARIDFVHVLEIDTNSTPFVALLAGTESETAARIATTGGASAAPVGPIASNVAELANGSVRFDVAIIPSTNYVVQYTANLTNTTWTTLLTTNTSASSFSITNKPTAATRFYRILAQ